VRRVDAVLAAGGGAAVRGQQHRVRSGGVNVDPGRADPQLHQHPRADHRRGHRVEAGGEGDQAVLADLAQVPVDHQVVGRRQRQQRGTVPDRAHGDDLTVGAVDLLEPDLGPVLGCDRELVEGVEVPPGQHVLAHDEHLAFDPPLAGRPVRRHHVDDEPVVGGERDRLRMQRDRLAWRDVMF
jgi:hypothetical protein